MRAAPQFPATKVPDSEDEKLLGIYRERDGSRVLQRVRIAGGRITPAQLRALAAAAQRAGARAALHLTTRQDIELHSLRPELIPETQHAIDAAGLTVVGAAGDTVRNPTVDPMGGLVPGNEDLLPLALAIGDALESLEGIWSLPRKFKISFSGDARAAMRPWISDVGVVARGDGSHDVVVAGSLGARPGAGVEFGKGISAADAAALTIASVRLHAAEGDRACRSRARLRHVRERLGDGEFTTALAHLWDEERVARRTILTGAAACVGTAVPPARLRLSVPGGELPLQAAVDMAHALEGAGGELRIGIEHDLHVFGLGLHELPEQIRTWVSEARVVACPGSALCRKAAGPTREASEVVGVFAKRRPDLLFSLSGCPNSCSHAAAAHVGITSRFKRSGDDRVPVYEVTAGGDAGCGPRLSHMVARDVPLGELADHIEAALLQCGAGPKTRPSDR